MLKDAFKFECLRHHFLSFELLRESGGFKGLFDQVRKNGEDPERELQEFLKEESDLFSIVGFKVRKLGDGYAELSFPFSSQISRYGGSVHGGVISYALDTASGLATMTQNVRIDQVTLELKVSFLEPLRNGPFSAVGKILRLGRTVAVAESEVRDVEDRMCAKALGSWYMIS
jgi:uncharacterized protein (TIGR00369 family)